MRAQSNTEEDKTDHAATQLLRGFSVSTDPRTYMIEVSYTARDPELAAVISNAFVTEFLRASRLQTLSLKRSLAATTLSQQLAIFGDKHPKAIKAKMQLAAADEQLKSQLSEVARLNPPECRRERHHGHSGACQAQDTVGDWTAAADWPHSRCRSRALARASEMGGRASSLLQQTLCLRIGDRQLRIGRRLPARCARSHQESGDEADQENCRRSRARSVQRRSGARPRRKD